MKSLGDALVKGMNTLVNEMKVILHERGIHWIAIEGALREFKKKHSHLSKDAVISYFVDAIDISELKAFHEFKKRATET